MNNNYPFGFKALVYDIKSKVFVSPAYGGKWYPNTYAYSDHIPTMDNETGIYASYKYKIAKYYLPEYSHSYFIAGDACIFLIAGMEDVVIHREGFRSSCALPFAVVDSAFSNLGAWYFGIPSVSVEEAKDMVKKSIRNIK